LTLLQDIVNDPRSLYPILFILIALPLVHPIGLPLNVSTDAMNIYDDLNSLPPGSVVLQTIDIGWVSWPELGDTSKAIFKFLLSKNLKVLIVDFETTAQGTTLAEIMFTQIQIPADKKYGVDYVNLGYIPGEEAAIAAFAKNIRAVTTKDARGTPFDQLPIMNNVNSIKDISFVMAICMSAGLYPEFYIRQIQLQYGTPLGAAVISSMAPPLKPYVDAGQLVGLMNSQRGGAEFELVSGFLGLATASMDSQSLAHAFVIIAVIAANILFLGRKFGGSKK